ncbi:MAG: DUF2971 domain-containing protein [Gammaproteobacteria bacterium]|nr:DUF2971 domain-containing protein [Gammaproteobacteria bacterium]MBU2056247.1 DUF2971 domain-containing protein [Gammaproteobacteria bacterium]MBU2174662.1 DUF2971 domain-containing protein [Gammaproteobacteria bacterium]MBU2248823.1 DUF2971 domain-containing protein [Gammaproteobacteria bacterium]MBU2345825.1 DUF2971 domain-containing protein [Gammaproteobacteria bacterium]
MHSLYKYCPIYDFDKLDNEYAITNVLKNQVTFSTRSNFNDLFDSKIDFVIPDKSELKRTYSLLAGARKREFKNMFMGENGKRNFVDLKKRLNKKFDEYLFFCLAHKADNNLMWSHYANSHKGFCLEWDASKINAEPVRYQYKIATFELLDTIKMDFDLIDKDQVGLNLWDALKVKLQEWDYEGEYRFQLGDGMRHLIQEQNIKFALVSYEPQWIKSIIFGCRMDKRAIAYLDQHLPSHIKRKYAQEGMSKIEIVSKN